MGFCSTKLNLIEIISVHSKVFTLSKFIDLTVILPPLKKSMRILD